MTPSIAPTVASTDSVTAEIRPIVNGLARLTDPKLVAQRVELDEHKTAVLSKLALGAKLDRALGRRMSSQDAVMRPRKPSAPPALGSAAAATAAAADVALNEKGEKKEETVVEEKDKEDKEEKGGKA